MVDPDSPSDDGLNRRDLLRGLQGGTIAAPLLLSGCSMPGTGGVSDGSNDQDGRTAVADDCGGPAGGQTTVTVEGEDYEVPVTAVRVPGTCRDLEAVYDKGGMDPYASPVEYEPEDPPHALRPDNFDTWKPVDTPDDAGDSPPNLVPAWDCEGSEETSDGHALAVSPSDWLLNGLEVFGDDLSWQVLDRSGPAGAKLDNRAESSHHMTGPMRMMDDGWQLGPSPLNDSIELERSETGPDSEFDYEKSISEIDVDIEFEPTIMLPDWHPTHAISEECKRRYCQKLREVFEHEKEHARNAFETAQEFEDPFDLENPPTVRYPEGTDEAKIDRMLYEEANALVYEQMRQAVCEKKRKDDTLHKEDRKGIDFFTFCEACTQCEAHDYRSYREVESWRMQVAYFYRIRDAAPNHEGGVTVGENMGSFLGEFELTTPEDLPNDDFLEWAGTGVANAWHYQRRRNWNDEGSLYSCQVFENRDRFAGDDFVEPFESGNGKCAGLARLAIDYQTEDQYVVQLPDCRSMGYNSDPCIQDVGGAIPSQLYSGIYALLNRESMELSAPDFRWPEVSWGSVKKSSPVYAIDECPWILTKALTQPLKKGREQDDLLKIRRTEVGPHLDGETVGAERFQMHLVPIVRDDDGCNHIDCL